MPTQLCGLWGSSGSGKTSLLNTFAIGQHRANGKRTRLYSAESAQRGPIDGAIAKGIVEAWFIDNAAHPFERIIDATQGAWPDDPNDPYSLVNPAFSYKWIAKCPQCATVVYTNDKQPIASAVLTCPKDKTVCAARVTREQNPKNGIGDIGAVMFEGGTAFGEMLMDNMTQRSAKGEKMGEDVAVRFKDGSAEVATSSRSSYGIAQRRVKGAVDASRQLPTSYVWWTFTAERGEDTDRRIPVFGPKLPGSAATPDVPRWFGPLLGVVRVPPIGNQPEEIRLYLRSYYQTWNDFTKGIECVVNTRIPPAQLREGRPDAVPSYFVYKPDNETLLWDVMQLIEERQRAAVAPIANKAT